MRGHWLSQTRKLNRHYQSAKKTLRVIRSEIINSTYLRDDGLYPSEDGYYNLYWMFGEKYTTGSFIHGLDHGQAGGYRAPGEMKVSSVMYDYGWYGIKWKFDDYVLGNYGHTYTPQQVLSDDGHWAFLINQIIIKDRNTQAQLVSAPRFQTTGSYNYDPSTYTYYVPCHEFLGSYILCVYGGGGFPLGSSNYDFSTFGNNPNTSSIESTLNQRPYSGAIYFYNGILQTTPSGPDIGLYVQRQSYYEMPSSLFPPIVRVKGEVWLEKYNMSPFEV